eukprot:scaffold4040_cov287-Ochromonas_danica.AAC.2
MECTLSEFMSSAKLNDLQRCQLGAYIQKLELETETITICSLLNLDDKAVNSGAILRAAKEVLMEYLKSLEPFNVANMKTWLYNGGHDTGDDFLRATIYPDLCVCKPSLSDLPEIMKQRACHKVLVVSGESGAGKSFSSIRLFPELLVRGEKYEKLLLFYCCRDPEASDLPEQKAIRDDRAYKQLEVWWDTCWNKIFDEYPQLNEKECKGAAVVMVVDELGNRPHLLRGLLSMATAFEKSCTTMIDGNNNNGNNSSSSVSRTKVGQFRLICVGTGLDWSVHHLDEDLASDPTRYHHISIQPWLKESFQLYAERNLYSVMPMHHQEVVSELMALQLSRIGSNPRCAEYLLDALRADGYRIENSLSPATTLFNLRGEIFREAASQYRNANGIAKLFGFHKDAACELLSSGLRLAYSQNLCHADLEKAKQLLMYGILRYDVAPDMIQKLYISPAMLLMLLSEFGYRDVTVLDGEDFERLVALRELGHILMEEARAKVFIITLKEPIPNTRANEMKNGKFSFKLPRRFFRPSPQGSTSVERMYKDAYYIIVNGPRAPSADVIVLPPETQMQRQARFIQAKKYVKGYNPSAIAFEKEVANLGLNEQAQQATYYLHQALANGRPMQHEFVLSCGDGNGGVFQSLNDKIAAFIQNNPAVDLKAEVVHPLWQSLLIDGDVQCENNKYLVQITQDQDHLSYSISSSQIGKRGAVEDDADDLGDLYTQLEAASL